MLRTAAPRALLRPLASSPAAPVARRFPRCASSSLAQAALRQDASLAGKAKPLALSTQRRDMSLVRSYATAVPGTFRDLQREAEISQRQMNAHPERVSAASTIHPVFSEVATPNKEEEVDMMAGIRHDLKVIKETFELDAVPPEAYRIGMAGVLPYLATSTATLVCAFEYNGAAHGSSFFLSQETAALFLNVLEPLQVGYGAVILSFLGAIHWGLEWAKYGGHGGYPRYAIGVLAPAVAWPTILLPVESALIAQFLAFNLLYAVDAGTSKRGWTPPWYQSYRFILTFIVGASIVISLIGRGQVIDRIENMENAAQRLRDRNDDKKNKKKAKKSKKAAEDDE